MERKIRIRRAGVVFNPTAGRADCFNTIGEVLSEKLSSCEEIITGPGNFGEEFIAQARVILPSNVKGSVLGLEEIVDAFYKLGIDLLIGVGGDGTLNVLGSYLLQRRLALPLMGIPAGTANVGPLLRFNRRALEQFDPDKVEISEIRPIEVWVNGCHRGYAFVDAVIGETFLGTVDGSMECLDVRAFLYDREKKRRNSTLSVMKRVCISKGQRTYTLSNVFQIIAAPIHHARFYIGKAITGALCWAWHLKKEAVVTFTSTNIVDPYVAPDNLAEREPVVVSHVLLGGKEVVDIKGIPEGKFLVLDGNPICSVEGQVIRIGVASRGVLVASNRSCEENCGPAPFDWDD